VKIYECLDHVETYREQPSYEFKTDSKTNEVFIGRSPKNQMTIFSGGFGDRFDGNTILIQQNDLQYIYVGGSIFKFTALAQIVKYVSPVGNNLVPYPYAVDLLGNYYLMEERVVLNNVNLTDKKEYQDPYDYYYTESLITADLGLVPRRKPTVDHFMDITDYFIGTDHYTFRYHPDPNDYDDLVARMDSDISVQKVDGSVVNLSKSDYANIMLCYGKLKGFAPMKIEKLDPS